MFCKCPGRPVGGIKKDPAVFCGTRLAPGGASGSAAGRMSGAVRLDEPWRAAWEVLDPSIGWGLIWNEPVTLRSISSSSS